MAKSFRISAPDPRHRHTEPVTDLPVCSTPQTTGSTNVCPKPSNHTHWELTPPRQIRTSLRTPNK
ncbi:unnamed protein product [Arabidopsis lyrata]|uniref:Predicted protein n=1 Tax=Arabidopsis lyrata subsp. lyrata TaxID=81972 RepID=D7KBS5_ARALL|nr:predicted protein [Arabidopsis lyrata subsp. lyrata]CAH8253697.1 unnamed protein product [Arabidopsis lyrata]